MNLLEAIGKLRRTQQLIAVYDALIETVSPDSSEPFPWEESDSVDIDVREEVQAVLLEKRKELEQVLADISKQEVTDGKPKRRSTGRRKSKAAKPEAVAG